MREFIPGDDDTVSDAVTDAYRKLGLVPLDEYLLQQIEANNGDDQDVEGEKYWGIGATTWMLITASLLFADGMDVTIVSHHGNGWAHELSEQFLQIWKDLGNVLELDARRALTLQFSNHPDELYQAHFLKSEDKGKGRGLVFDEQKWKGLAVQRSMGPWGLIRHIYIRDTLKDGRRWLAHDAARNFLVELTLKGFEQIQVDNRFPDIKIWHQQEKPPKDKYEGKPPHAAAGWQPK